MKKLILALLIAALLLPCAALAEEDGDFGFDFGDEGYTGEWVRVDGMSLEFCLPEGWEQTGEASYAASDDAGNTVALTITVAAEGVEDILAWGESNLNVYEICGAGFYDVLVEETDERLTACFLDNSNCLIRFEFVRSSRDALSRDFALQIVGSINESWLDEGPMLSDEEEDAFDIFSEYDFEDGLEDEAADAEG
ncbi:MAG: hypothetical protein Q4C10_14025 [Clostridia bacterium]|nr:hypothetical protein [Clostridia bacterium]